jgi:hypothetical protein
MTSDILPDQIHIEQIKRRLWCGREFGQASVLIGTGFSRNADKASSNAFPFPLWRNIAEGMYKTLYLSYNDSSNDLIRATSGNGSLKLASEYEITFGRSALDDYLLQAIDDRNYYPSELHKLLLSLPWSDIFTTNYDTLLERTQISVYERKYDLVETYSDIPGKMKPRIVKLHGSFPSHRPFIITEEDFRTYPKKFAPFVNLVQQSLMENAFCLIGFSGDDPNFLNWIGWIRDNLGGSKPPIYLCGLFEKHSPSERKLFEQKGIIPIDISPKFKKSEFIDSDECYKEAIKWFLDELKSGEPPNKLNWPYVEELMEPSHTNTLSFDNLRELSETWYKNRNDYPGWVVAPKEYRDKLWLYTFRWVNPILKSIDDLSFPNNLHLIYELNWRLGKTLTPLLFNNLAEKISRIVEEINPFPRFLKMTDAKIRPDVNKYQEFNWKYLSEYWLELAFALVRYAREKQYEEMFLLWSDRLEKISNEQNELKARICYEKCLFYLFQFDKKKVYNIVQNWPKINHSLFYEAMKASILAELGELKRAENIAQEALYNIRSQINPYNTDFKLLSQEGWLMYLLQKIKNNLSYLSSVEEGTFSFGGDYLISYKNRWDKLEAYRCNPNTEIELLCLYISSEFIAHSELLSYSSSLNSSRAPSSFSFFRLFDEIAFPINIGYFKLESTPIVNSAKQIMSYSFYWSLINIIRSGDTKDIDKMLDDIVIGTLSQKEIDNCGNIFIIHLEQQIKDLRALDPSMHPSKGYLLENPVGLTSKVLSCLCIRFSNEKLDKLFELTVEMYYLPIVGSRLHLYDSLRDLFKRILCTMPQTEILKKIDKLLSLPIPTDNGFNVSIPNLWIEPFIYIEFSENEILISNFERSSWDGPIANLLRIVETGTKEARSTAVIRLKILNDFNWLTDNEFEHFVKYLWEKIDPKKGLPADIPFLFNNTCYFFDYYFLRFLDTDIEEKAKAYFRNNLILGDFPRMKQSVNKDGTLYVSMELGIVQYINEWIGGTEPLFSWQKSEKKIYINWESSDIIQLLDKAISWWDDEKYYLQNFGNLKNKFESLLPLISNVILPRIEIKDIDSISKIKRLLSELEKADICTLRALPMLLRFDLNSCEEIAQKIRFGLNSTKVKEIFEATESIFIWIVFGKMGILPSPPIDIIDELVNRVTARRQPGLISFINCVSSIVKRCSDALSDKQIESLCISLQYLIKEIELSNRKEFENRCTMQTTIIPRVDLPKYRKASAKLAYDIYMKFIREEKEIPQILLKWKDNCLNDPFPEVRKLWD